MTDLTRRKVTPWQVVLPVSLGTGLSLIGDSALYTVLPLNVSAAGITLAGAGLLLSVNRVVRLIFNTPVGVIYDRWPRRALFLPALFLGTLSTSLYALTTGFWPLFVGRVLWGLAWTGIWVGGNTMILDITGETDRGRWVGRYQAAFFLGAAGGALAGGLLTDLLGYRLAMVVAAACHFVGAVLAWVLLPETQGTFQREELPSRQPVTPEARGQGGRPVEERCTAYALLGVNRLVVAGVIPATFGLFIQGRLVGVEWSLPGGVGVASLTGLGLGMTTLISMATVPWIGRWSDRTPTRWHVVIFGLALGTLGFISLSLRGLWLIIPGMFLIAWMSGSNTSLSTALVGDLTGLGRRSRHLGVLYTIGDLGSAIGPPLAFFLLPLIGLEWIYVGLAGVLALMMLSALRWIQPALGPP